MAVTLYGFRSCDTVRKAITWLDAQGVDYTFHDYRKIALDAGTVDGWFARAGWEAVFNRNSAAFRALPLVDLLRTALKRAQADGNVRRDYSADRLARTLANVFFITALQWAAYRQDRSVHEEFRLALTLGLDGLRVTAQDGQPAN